MSLDRLPHRLDETTLPGVLSKVGLPMADVHHLVASGKPLALSGYKQSVRALDEAIAKNTSLDISERIRLKMTLIHHGLIGG